MVYIVHQLFYFDKLLLLDIFVFLDYIEVFLHTWRSMIYDRATILDLLNQRGIPNNS